ncbi:MAG: penicillin-binding protein 1C [Brachymonas sp.]|nr:penicillin-binding protein 1C [Brachymonas sp.]
MGGAGRTICSNDWRGLLLALCLSAASLPTQALPSFAQVRQSFASSESVLLDRHGNELHRLRTNPQVRRGQWVALEDISPALQSALIYSEDKRFYQHSGVDWRAVGAAAWGNVWNQKTRGASTLTMQLVGLMNDDLRRGTHRRSLMQKFGQAISAQTLDAQWQKSEILEAYLNLVPFRGEMVGIDALSRTLFGKAPHGLNEREAAIAAVLVRAPNATPQAVAQRACGLLAQMHQVARTPLLCDSLSLFATGVMQRKAWSPSEGMAPHLAQRLLAGQPGGSQMRTTLSAPLQRYATEQLRQTLHELTGRNVRDGAIIVLDNATGDVLAWVGASATTSSAPQVDYVLAPRQPGSTLKPFLYAQAIAERRLTAASLLDDSAAAIPTQSGLYVPNNYDRHFRGWVSLRQAVAASLNVPAVRTIGMVGVNRFADQLQRLGITLRHTGEHYGYSLALGSAEMNLLQLSNAYRALANGGRYSPARWLAAAGQPPAAKQVLDARASFIINHILADNNARIPTFGSNSVLHTRFWTAVKTGTSKDMRDNWAIGYSERYTVGVWVGNAQGQAMWDVSGTTGAAPIWAALMRHLHRDLPSRAPQPPAGLVQTRVTFSHLPDRPVGRSASHTASPATARTHHAARHAHFSTNAKAHGQASQQTNQQANGGETNGSSEPPRMEWFIQGTEQAAFVRPPSSAQAATARILNPVSGSLLALDPDIPPQRQRLMLRASAASASAHAYRWLINGKRLGQGQTLPWLPWPGKHRITLQSAQGQTLDEVQIEVRGAAVAKHAAQPGSQRRR